MIKASNIANFLNINVTYILITISSDKSVKILSV